MFLDAFDLGRLLKGNNMILSHSFVARSNLLSGPVLDDPKLESIEDVYLYLLLVARGADIRFTGRVSVIWNWRSVSRDNSMLTVADDRKALCVEKIVRRLSDYRFLGSYLGQQVLWRGYPATASQTAPEVQQTAPWVQRIALVAFLARVSVIVLRREGPVAVLRKSRRWCTSRLRRRW
jgi:hypothetical protein